MNGNRWQSSSRSLSVRTVWVNGQHHVILFEKDPLRQHARARQKHITRSFSCDTKLQMSSPKSSSPLPNPSSDVIFRASTARLFTNRTRYEKAPGSQPAVPRNPRQQSTSDLFVVSLPSPQLKLKSMDLEGTATHCNLRVIRRDDHIDNRNRKGSSANKGDNSPHSSIPDSGNLPCNRSGNDSLSERVMHWLDLAAVKDEDTPNTAGELRTKTPKSAVVEKDVSQGCLENEESSQEKRKLIPKNDYFDMEKSISKSNQTPEDSSLGSDDVTMIPLNDCMKREEIEVPSSTGAVASVIDQNGDPPRQNGTDRSRKQIHIFIPDIGNQNSDCDSNISNIDSKTSSVTAVV